MTRSCFALAALVLALLPGLAEAKYRMPSAAEVLGNSSLIVIGEVESVGEGAYTVKITEQVVGPKVALKGSIEIVRRAYKRKVCKPMDPRGVVAGTRWVWVIEPTDKAKLYRSWTSAPFQIQRDANKVERVQYNRLIPKGVAQAPSLKTFVALIQSYRRCYRFGMNGMATQIVPAAELEAFLASSPYAVELVRRTPRAKKKTKKTAAAGVPRTS